MAIIPQRTKNGLLKQEILALYLAAKDNRTPMLAKILGIAVVGYALSPVDLIPDFIPVIGWLDDLVIVPLGLWGVSRLIPPNVYEEARRRASGMSANIKRIFWLAGAALFVSWLALMALALMLLAWLAKQAF